MRFDSFAAGVMMTMAVLVLPTTATLLITGATGQGLSLEQRVLALEQKTASFAVDPVSAWNPHRFPIDGIPPTPPIVSYNDAVVSNKPIVIEDRRITNALARSVLAARLGDDWRTGPASKSHLYYGGRPKFFHRGGAFFTETNDTVDIGMLLSGIDEQTGAITPIGHCTAIGRIYSAYWEGPTQQFQPRSQDMVFKKDCGIDIKISKNAALRPPITSLHVVEPPNLHSGGTGLIMGFSDVLANGDTVKRPVKLGRVNELPPGVFVLYVTPLE